MSDPIYPNFLPNPQTGFAQASTPRLNRTEMDDGHARQVQRFDAILEGYSVSWLFTHDEYELFRAWVYHELASGAAWFNINLPLEYGESIFKTTRARFIEGQYRGTSLGFRTWRVEAVLETEESTVLTESQFGSIAAWGDDLADFLAFGDLFHIEVHGWNWMAIPLRTDVNHTISAAGSALRFKEEIFGDLANLPVNGDTVKLESLGYGGTVRLLPGDYLVESTYVSGIDRWIRLQLRGDENWSGVGTEIFNFTSGKIRILINQ